MTTIDAPTVTDQPQTASEKYLAALWEEIIGIEGVTRPQRFLDVGGNSLTLNIILNRIESETGAAIRPELFFDDETSSLAQLAAELDALWQAK
jgi:acyl carrier protein